MRGLTVAAVRSPWEVSKLLRVTVAMGASGKGNVTVLTNLMSCGRDGSVRVASICSHTTGVATVNVSGLTRQRKVIASSMNGLSPVHRSQEQVDRKL